MTDRDVAQEFLDDIVKDKSAMNFHGILQTSLTGPIREAFEKELRKGLESDDLVPRGRRAQLARLAITLWLKGLGYLEANHEEPRAK